MIPRANQLIRHRTFRTEYIPIGICIQSDFNFFNITPIREFTSSFKIIDNTSSYPFGLPTRPKLPPVSLFKYILNILRSNSYTSAVICIDGGGELVRLLDLMIAYHDPHMNVETTRGYASTINEKMDLPKQIWYRNNSSTMEKVKNLVIILSIHCMADYPSHQLLYHQCFNHNMV